MNINDIIKHENQTEKSYLITGGAGTGKSSLLLLLASNLRKSGKRVQVISPTGLASQNVAGKTLHSFLGISHKKTYEENKEQLALKFNRFAKGDLELDVIIIDEISMFTIANFTLLDFALRRTNDHTKPFGGVRVFMFGDFLQLPPITSLEENLSLLLMSEQFVFESSIWEDINPKIIMLDEVKRVKGAKTDVEAMSWIETLNNIRMMRNIDDIKINLERRVAENHEWNDQFSLDSFGIYATNKEVDTHNMEVLKSLESDLVQINEVHHNIMDENDIDIIIEENEELKHIRTLDLKEGAKIMFIKNDHVDKKYFNGSRGMINKIIFDENEVEKIIITLDEAGENDLPIELHRTRFFSEEPKLKHKAIFQFPIRLAYAFTVNKSQGQTIPKENKLWIDIEPSEDHERLEGKLYTALSRVEEENQIKFRKFSIDSLAQPQSALEFYNNIIENGIAAKLNEYNFFEVAEKIGVDKKIIDNEDFSGVKNSLKNYIKYGTFELGRNSISKHERILAMLKNEDFKYVDFDSLSLAFEYEDVYDLNLGKNIIKYDKEKVDLIERSSSVIFREKESKRIIPSVSYWSRILSEQKSPMPKNKIQELGWNLQRSKSVSYGNSIDDNKYLMAHEKKVDLKHANILRNNLKKIKEAGLKIVAVSVPVVHKTLSISGEIDQILYHEETDTYFVSDTKTSKRNPVASDWKYGVNFGEKNIWQVALYIDILKSNNPNLNISDIAVYDWIRDIKSESFYKKNDERDNSILSKYGEDEIFNNATLVEEEILEMYEENNGVEPDGAPYVNSLVMTKIPNNFVPDFASFPPNQTTKDFDEVIDGNSKNVYRDKIRKEILIAKVNFENNFSSKSLASIHDAVSDLPFEKYAEKYSSLFKDKLNKKGK